MADRYTETHSAFKLPVDEQLSESKESRIDIDKTKPRAVLNKWDGEVAMGISYEGVRATGKRKSNTNIIEFKNGNKEVHMYPLDNGDFEIEVVLNSKPNTNVFNFTIDGHEELDFFYQPQLPEFDYKKEHWFVDMTTKKKREFVSYYDALTEEEQNKFIIIKQPENVIGSYAVYHKNKVNHIKGQTNYGIGKLFHIYRPKAIDSNGDEIWGELSYTEGELRVTIDQSWLDNATYPIKIDPTIGYTTIGASNEAIAFKAIFPPFVNVVSSIRLGSTFSVPDGGELTDISAWVLSPALDFNVDLTMYINEEDSGGSGIHAELASAELLGITLINDVDTLVTSSITGTLAANTDYILNISGQPNNVLNFSGINVKFDIVGADKDYLENFIFPNGYANSKEDPWTVADAGTFHKHSIFATYEVICRLDMELDCRIGGNSDMQLSCRIGGNLR